jgi:hypothetical protein
MHEPTDQGAGIVYVHPMEGKNCQHLHNIKSSYSNQSGVTFNKNSVILWIALPPTRYDVDGFLMHPMESTWITWWIKDCHHAVVHGNLGIEYRALLKGDIRPSRSINIIHVWLIKEESSDEVVKVRLVESEH